MPSWNLLIALVLSHLSKSWIRRNKLQKAELRFPDVKALRDDWNWNVHLGLGSGILGFL